MSIYFTSLDFAWLDAANKRGFDQNNPLVTTKSWGAIRKHPSRDEWCVEIPEDWLPRLGEVVPSEELASNAQGPFTKEQLTADGWFAEV